MIVITKCPGCGWYVRAWLNLRDLTLRCWICERDVHVG